MEQFQHISVDQTKQRLDQGDLVIVDIRDETSYEAAHIPSAIHLSNGNLTQFVNEHEFDQAIVVCCYHGISSQQAAQYLLHQGFNEVYSMDGGFEAWKGAYPSESGSSI